jgi:hypothetical protein
MAIKNSIKPKIDKKVDKRIYYQSIYLKTIGENELKNDSFSVEKCKIVLYFIKYNIHFNLLDEYEIVLFLNYCLNIEF